MVEPLYFGDNDPWDARLILLYYIGCVLSFFLILMTAILCHTLCPVRRLPPCDETVTNEEDETDNQEEDNDGDDENITNNTNDKDVEHGLTGQSETT